MSALSMEIPSPASLEPPQKDQSISTGPCSVASTRATSALFPAEVPRPRAPEASLSLRRRVPCSKWRPTMRRRRLRSESARRKRCGASAERDSSPLVYSGGDWASASTSLRLRGASFDVLVRRRYARVGGEDEEPFQVRPIAAPASMASDSIRASEAQAAIAAVARTFGDVSLKAER
eukprot:scaffold161752_cov32-Tisochrysis_lutea.AAC.2